MQSLLIDTKKGFYDLKYEKIVLRVLLILQVDEQSKKIGAIYFPKPLIIINIVPIIIFNSVM